MNAVRDLPRTLSFRLIVTAVALVALVSLLLAGVTTVLMRNYLVGKLDQQVMAVVGAHDVDRDDHGPMHGRPMSEGPMDAEPLRCGPGPNSRALRVTSLGVGGVLNEACAYTPINSRNLAQLLRVPMDGRAHNVNLRGTGHYRVMAGKNPAGQTVIGGLPMNDITDTIRNLLAFSMVLAVGGTVLAGVLGGVLVRRQLRPLRAVAATAHEVTRVPLDEGDQSTLVRVPAALTDERTEVGQVGSALNTLLDHVDAALDARHRSELQVRQFVADASHELRTPLSTIHGYAELSRRTPDDANALSHAMTKVETEAHRMSGLVEDLLLLARLDSGRPLQRESVDLTRLLLEATSDAQLLGPEHVWRLDLPAEPVTLTGDEQRLHQVITNLMNNARQHTPAGTQVTVGTCVDSGTVLLWVHDNGPGIPTELQPTVFERFTRGDSSRTRSSGGAGLGLSLVHAIVAAHGGTVELRSQPGDTTFTVRLPDQP